MVKSKIKNKPVFVKRFGFATVMLFTALMVFTPMLIWNSLNNATIPVQQEVNPIASSEQLPINLGTAANYVILTKAGITTTGITVIIGNMGTYPIAATAITGFGLIMDSSNQFSRSSLVTGKIYANGYADPTPANLLSAVNDMETARLEAFGRTLPDHTELGAGLIGGMTLTPGLYKWSSGVSISTDVTLLGDSDDVWIFQIAQTLTVSSTVKVILSGGAQANNIFWEVEGQTTLGSTSVFCGNILDNTAIVFNNGAKLNGRALAKTAVTLIANTIINPVDTISPLVSSKFPIKNAINVPLNSKITATFSEVMNNLTIDTDSFIITQNGNPVSGIVSYSGITAVFIPSSDLLANKIYNVTITTDVEDLNGNALEENKSWNFTTSDGPDIILPTVTHTVPNIGATRILTNSKIVITFSEFMDPLTINSTTFTLKKGTATILGLVSYSI